MEGPPLGPGGEDITWPDQVAPRGQKASSTRKIKPQTSNLASLHTVTRSNDPSCITSEAQSATTPSHHGSSRTNFAAEQFEKEYPADEMDSKSAAKSLYTGGGDETPGMKRACVRATRTRCSD